MSVHVVRLGSPRGAHEGPRLGTARRPPRGVPKSEFATRDFYDVWLPLLAPSAALIAWLKAGPLTAQRWNSFARKYRREMQHPEARQMIATLAVLSRASDFAVGCYCEDPSRCHRSLLGELLHDAGASMA